MKTTVTDLDMVTAYLKNEVGWTELDQIKAVIPKKHVNGLKVEAMRHLGLLDRDGQNVKLTTAGRDYASGDDVARAGVIGASLKSDPLYFATLKWMHHSRKTSLSKTDIAHYWNENHETKTGGALGDALTDSTVFFMRMIDAAGLGKFVAAGNNRESHVEMDAEKLAESATGEPPPPPVEEETATGNDTPIQSPPQPRRPPAITVGAGLNVNVEIHIAADAKAATIQEIFKNMRKYLIDGPDAADGG